MEDLREEHHKAERKTKLSDGSRKSKEVSRLKSSTLRRALEETATTHGRRTDNVGGDSDGTVHVPEASHVTNVKSRMQRRQCRSWNQ